MDFSHTYTQGFLPVASDDDDHRDDEDHLEALTDQEHKVRVVISPRAQLLELVALIIDICACLTRIYHESDRKSVAAVVFPTYLAILLATRLRLSRGLSDLPTAIRAHAEALYCVQWPCLFFLAHTTWVVEADYFRLEVALIRLAAFTCLVLVHWTAPRLPEGHQENGASIGTSKNPSREETASFLSALLFAWMEPLLWEAFRGRRLDASKVADTYPLAHCLSSTIIASRFRAKTSSTKTILWRIFGFFKFELLKQGLWAALTGVLVFLPPIFIKLILEYLESTTVKASTAWLYVFGLFAASFMAGLADCQCGWSGYRISARLRAVLLDEVYAKIMRRRMVSPSSENLSTAAVDTISDGAIYNFVSGDIDFISSMSGNLYLVWVTFPVQIFIGTALLYQLLGLSGILGVFMMLALLPLNIVVSKRLAAVQSKLLAASDARIQSSNELLEAIRVIKYYAWESYFLERVSRKREAELEIMRTRFVWWSISMTIFYSLPFIVTIFTFFFHTIVWHRTLGTTVAFPALACFGVLRIPLNRMADSITYLIQAHVSLLRVTKFLEERETEKSTQSSVKDPTFIGFENATLTWPTSGSSSRSLDGEDIPLDEVHPGSLFRLNGIDVKFQQNSLTVICGSSGSGKSSLLLALLGEMYLQRGKVFLPHWQPESTVFDHGEASEMEETAAYCPHEPWIINQSIRANILLETPLIASRYEMVLQSVALVEDLAMMTDGDLTLAGENGMCLSGGQKQRVSLARALYSYSRYVFLDDCLSALDSRTARHIFFQGIKGPLLKGRTCVLATHHGHLTIPHCDLVVILEAGRVKYQGPPGTQGVLSESSFSAVINQEGAEEDDQRPDDKNNLPLGDRLPNTDEGRVQKESKSGEGAVSWSVIRGYLLDMGAGWFWILVFAGFAIQQLVSLGTNLWIKTWAFQYDNNGIEQRQDPEVAVQAWYYLSVYTAICVSYALVTLLRDLITFSGSLKASAAIHARLLYSVTYAKFAFFERPAGQITNRFSKDTNVVDQSLATFSVSAFQIAATVVMVIGLIIWAIPRIMLILILGIVCVAYAYITSMYIQGAQDLKRIEASARSPLYQQVGETLSGFVSIRGYGREALFSSKHRKLVDSLNQPYLLLWASKQWLTMRVNILSSTIALVAAAFVVWEVSSIDAGIAGLVLTYAATFTENMLWLIQIYAIIQQSLTSVERIAEYSSVERETVSLATGLASSPLGFDRQQQGWPEKGRIAFHNFTARYGPTLTPVLKSLSFHAASGERIAIVGRTGAGKSSVALALLRVLEADQDGGWIEVDGVDIATVTLAELRGKAITIIPQDPQLFSGTVRTNLDPRGEHTDDEIRRVLHSMQGKSQIDHFELDKQASDLSRGQSQLLCVARGLLRNTRILVLDEATASVDHETDEAIQRGLRQFVALGNTTVITIAHRLLTVADYDRVLVLDAGMVAEQGEIRELLGPRGKGGMFQSLCEESGCLEDIRKVAGV